MAFYKKLMIVIIIVLVLVMASKCTQNSNDFATLQPFELGHHLFFDKGLSYNNETSCASCHDPSMAFTDSYRRAFNYEAQKLETNTPSLLNLQDYPYFSWSDSNITDLQKQMLRPLFSTDPIEIGLHLDSFGVFKALDHQYGASFEENYQSRMTSDLVIDAIVQYLNQLQSRNSIVDRITEDSTILDTLPAIKIGRETYYAYSCNKCHGGRDFNIPDYGLEYPSLSIRIPSLRNVSITKPYMHDGHVVTLSEAIMEHSELFDNQQYVLDNNIKFPHKEYEIRSIIYFLYALTDTTYHSKSLFLDPNKSK